MLKNLTWLAAGNIAVKPVWFIFITYVCIRSIGAEEYGIMSAALALMSIVDGTLMFGTATLATREIARERASADRYFTNYLVTRGILSLAGVGIGLGIALLLGNQAVLVTVFWAGIFVVTRSLIFFLRAFFQAHEIFRREAESIVAEKVLVVACGSAALLFQKDATTVLVGMSVGTLLAALISYRWVVREFAQFERSLLDMAFVRKTMPVAIPLGLATLFILLFMRTDSVMIEYFVGDVETAQYGLAFRVLEALALAPALLTAVLLPRLSILQKHHQRRFNRLSVGSAGSMFVIAIAISAIIYLLSPLLIRMIDPSPEMMPAIELLRVLIWAFPLSATSYLLSTSLTAANRERLLAVVLGFAAVLNIGLNIWLIRVYGPAGAAAATVATQAFALVVFASVVVGQSREGVRADV